jgi:hypothetical protein
MKLCKYIKQAPNETSEQYFVRVKRIQNKINEILERGRVSVLTIFPVMAIVELCSKDFLEAQMFALFSIYFLLLLKKPK